MLDPLPFECDRFPPRHCEVVRRRRFREEGVPDYDRGHEAERAQVVIDANAEVESLAAKIGKLVVFIETYAGDCSEMERERWKLVSQMHRLLEWIKRQDV